MGIIDTNLGTRYSSPSPDPQTALTLRRSLKILNTILKEFASVRMLPGIRAMGEVGSSVLAIIPP
jgi:hypothetical protein